jgi:mannosyltransferase
LCLAALAWRVHGLTFQSLWRDEVDSIRFASRAFSEVIGMFSKPGENGPLFFALLRPWLAAAGRSEFALRYQAVMAGVLAVPLTFIVARRLMAVVGSGGSPTLRGLRLGNVALIAAALVAANPYLTWYGQEGKMYAALVAAVLASQVAFLVALGASRWWQWALYLAMVGIAGLLHVMAVLVIVVDAAWLLLLWPRYRRRWLPFLVTLLVPLAPYVVLAGWWQVRLFLNPTFQTGHPFVPFDVLASSLLTLTSHGVSGLASAWLLAPIVFVLLCGIVFAGRIGATDTGEAPAAHMRGWRLTSMLLAWIVLPPLLLFLLSLSKPMVADRYVIWIAPALLLLLAQGIAALATFWRPLGWAALLAVLGIALWGGWQQSHTPIKADLRGAAAYVESRRAPGELVMFQIPYLRHTYEYYAGPLKGGVDGLYTNSGSAPDQVAHEMASVVGDAPAVWLVLSEDSLWDSRGLVPAWLGAQGRLADRQVFQRVTVMRYEMGEVDK